MIKPKQYKKPGPHIWLGQFIRERRIQAGYNQTKLAAELGYNSDQFSLVEKGVARLKPVMAIKFCEITKTEPAFYIHRQTEAYREKLIKEFEKVLEMK
jgi:transcriptional regulator with XRE-family HTH domain